MNAHRRYLLLYELRWLPTGLLIPVGVLLALHRGLSLAEFGSVAALQGIVVMVLELPTGGLTDALGRRPVLLLAGTVGVAASGVLLVARSVPLYAVYLAGMGIFRALDSGPLEAWYVDHALAADPSADIESGLSHGAVVLGVAVGGGALLSGGLVAAGPVGPLPLAVPVAVAFGLQIASVAAVAGLMTEERPGRGLGALVASVRGVPAAIAGAAGLLRRSRVIVALVTVELFWGFGMVTYETLMPVRLTEVIGSPDRASALMGPAGSAAGLIGAYLFCYATQGASNPVHSALLHRQVEGAHRASLVSLNSMVSQPAYALGGVALTAVATRAGTAAAMLAGAAVLAVAAPFYLVKSRPESTVEFRARPPAGISTPRALTPGGNRCSP